MPDQLNKGFASEVWGVWKRGLEAGIAMAFPIGTAVVLAGLVTQVVGTWFPFDRNFPDQTQSGPWLWLWSIPLWGPFALHKAAKEVIDIGRTWDREDRGAGPLDP